MRWFIPPPILTASFSSIRIPGVVLRVSSTFAFKPFSSAAYLAVIVAMPLIRCIMLSISLSVCNNERTFPSTSKTMSPGFTCAPSLMNTVTFNAGSNFLNTFKAISTPASTPSSFINRCCLPISSSGMQQSVVWSPSPISSAKAKSSRPSISSSFVFITIKILVQRYYVSYLCRKNKYENQPACCRKDSP